MSAPGWQFMPPSQGRVTFKPLPEWFHWTRFDGEIAENYGTLHGVSHGWAFVYVPANGPQGQDQYWEIPERMVRAY